MFGLPGFLSVELLKQVTVFIFVKDGEATAFVDKGSSESFISCNYVERFKIGFYICKRIHDTFITDFTNKKFVLTRSTY